MFEALVSWLKGKEEAGTPVAEVEAAADLLVWTMFADGHIASAEEETVEAELRALGWSSPYSLDIYLSGAVSRARRAIADAAVAEGYLARCVARLEGAASRAKVLAACEKIAAVDGNTSASESAFIERLRAAFAAA